MKIAEQIVKNGVTTSEGFNLKLIEYIILGQISKVIETGTHMGEGTTKSIIKGLQVFTGPFNFYSIEVNPDYYYHASNLYNGVEGLHLLNGISIGKSDIPVDTTFNVPDFVVIDHLPQYRHDLYMKEVAYNVPDHQLDVALKAFDYRPELIVLDSAGFMGYHEFLYVMQRLKGECLLALDDTDHVKHYLTMEIIRSHPEKFEILWEVRSITFDPINGEKFGSAIIKVNG